MSACRHGFDSWQLRQFGFGFHALRRDWIAIGGILGGMAVFFTLSAQGGWMFPMMAVARALLFLAAATGVLLNRFCQQMGGGEIARVIRFVITYVAIRCLMNVIFAMNRTLGPVSRELEDLLNVVFPWIFLFGVNLRARVAVRAQSELALLTPSSVSPGPCPPGDCSGERLQTGLEIRARLIMTLKSLRI